MRDYQETVVGLRGAAKGLRELNMPRNAKRMEDAADAIEELLPIVPKWHPVNEPPKENKEYLVYIPNVGLVTKANYLYGKWNYDSLHMEINHLVSHWMPLPKAPKEVE